MFGPSHDQSQNNKYKSNHLHITQKNVQGYPKKPSNKKSQRLSPTSTFSPSLSVSMVTVSSSSGSFGSGGATPSTSEARCSRRSLNESYRDPFLGKKTSTKMMRCTITSYKIKIFPSTKIGFVGNFRCFFLGGVVLFRNLLIERDEDL